MKSLSPSQRRELRARAHGLHPVAMISEDGLSAGVLAEIERGLKVHELIKIRVFGADREQRELLSAEICSKTGALPVQHIGKILIVYREKPVEEEAPRRPPVRRPPASGRAEPPARRSASPGAKRARPAAPDFAARRARPQSPSRSSTRAPARPRRGSAVARPSQRRPARTR